MIWVAVGMAVVSMAASSYAGAQQQKAANKAAYANELQAARAQGRINIETQYAKEDLVSKVKQIRKDSLNARGQQMAAMAKAGVVVGNGSTQAMLDQTKRLTEQDAVVHMQMAARQVTANDIRYRDTRDLASASAESLAEQGRAARISGNIQGVSNAAQLVGGAYISQYGGGTTGTSSGGGTITGHGNNISPGQGVA